MVGTAIAAQVRWDRCWVRTLGEATRNSAGNAMTRTETVTSDDDQEVISMTNPADCPSSREAWLPSAEQPEPKRLGDFLKLLGQSIQSDSTLGKIHLCSVVQVTPCTSEIDFDGTMKIVGSAMYFSRRMWQESHIGGPCMESNVGGLFSSKM